MHTFQTVQWSPVGTGVRIIDQTRLPEEFLERDLCSLAEICDAIHSLAVRGAPAIGVTAALGLASLAAAATASSMAGATEADPLAFQQALSGWGDAIRSTRPTAVNLAWAIDRMLHAASFHFEPDKAVAALRVEAQSILDEDKAMCRSIGEHGACLLKDGMNVLTHCNAGALATAGIGTALAPIYTAAANGLRVNVFAGETRPLLQGSRLTAWELARAGIPVTILTDGMAASLMSEGRVDCCIVGADRIACNGDTANKIGTYSLAIISRHFGVPFYVAAPVSTLDTHSPNGSHIPIEFRSGRELAFSVGLEYPRDGIDVFNPAFDVTPAELVSAIITDRGVHYPPYNLGGLAGRVR